MFITLTMMYVFGFLTVREALSTVCENEFCTLRVQSQQTDSGEEVVNWGGPPFGYIDRLRPDQVKVLGTFGLTLNEYGWLGALQMGIPILIYLLIALGLFWRKSDDWMALFISVMIATFPLQNTPLPFTLAIRHPSWEWINTVGRTVAVACFFAFPLIFPTGQFVPRWTRWMAWFVAGSTIIVTGFGVPIERNTVGNVSQIEVWAVALVGTGVYAQLYRYFRVATPVERQQIKWLIVGMAVFLITGEAALRPWDSLLTSRLASMDLAQALAQSTLIDVIFTIASLFIPVSIVISVLRYRLWDIDIIINRTLVYGTLTASVIGIYVLVVGVLGTTIQGRGNLLISILATGLVAILVQPLRDRLQRGVNRMMYGERDDPVTVLSRLGQRLEGTLAPDAVLPSLVETVAQTLKLPYVAIETTNTRLDSQPETGPVSTNLASPTISYGSPQLDVIRLPLVYHSETIGYLVVSPRAPGEVLSPMDRHLLENIAHQAGMALHAVSLTADLQRSRQRLVTTREEERRRLRRDLHDGLGPNLASQGLKLAAVKQLLENDPTTAIPLLDQVIEQNKSTVTEVRRLVYGLRPPALDELGLVAAIRDCVTGMDGKASLQIEIAEPDDGLPPLSAAVEVAAYRIVLEALTNVIRHAKARHCKISFSTLQISASNMLQIDIQDDGIGFPSTYRAGVGTHSMRERAEEVGGTCLIESVPDGGTCVRAQLPIIKESAHGAP